MKFECIHADKTLRKSRNNQNFIAYQCNECGAKASNWISHNNVDLDGLELWETIDRETGRQVVNDEIPASKHEEFSAQKYKEYLSRDVWNRRRQKILDRAGGICEGCLSCAATEVHHLTYNHRYNEFAFELVALCASCHRRYHNCASDER